MNIQDFIRQAIREDVGNGDHTSLACIPQNTIGRAKLIVKESGILAGVELAREIFGFLDGEIEFIEKIKEGARVEVGDIAFEVEGSVHTILLAERLVLNCMQRMSGIATVTNRISEKVKSYGTKILDTRKTTPGIRFLEKWAVKIGGGENHRFGLFDMIMIKDNHIDYAGGIQNAILAVEEYQLKNKLNLKVEIEARDLEEVKQIVGIGKVNRIMLDNFSPVQIKEALQIIAGKYETEASGGITEETVVSYAECGVDYISLGMLTHSVKGLDLSLKAF